MRTSLRRRSALAIGAAALVATVLSAAPSGVSATASYAVGNAASGYATLLTDPAAIPPGINVWACHPSSAHPRPVILLPGTLWTLTDSFAALGPILANNGYCVFGLNYVPHR